MEHCRRLHYDRFIGDHFRRIYFSYQIWPDGKYELNGAN